MMSRTRTPYGVGLGICSLRPHVTDRNGRQARVARWAFRRNEAPINRWNNAYLSRTNRHRKLFIVFLDFLPFTASESLSDYRFYTRITESRLLVFQNSEALVAIHHPNIHPSYIDSIHHLMPILSSQLAPIFTLHVLFDRLVQSYHSLAAPYFIDIQYSLPSSCLLTSH